MPTTSTCPKCGDPITDEMGFCGRCGQNLQQHCPACENDIRWHLEFCPKCGANIREKKAEIEAESERKRTQEAQLLEKARVEEQARKEKLLKLKLAQQQKVLIRKAFVRKHWWKLAALLAIAAAVIGYRSYRNSDLFAYGQAGDLYEEGKLEEAISAFGELGDYRDSRNRADGIRYEIADSLYRMGELRNAVIAFNSLGSFGDAIERSQAIRYEIAESLYESSDIEGAVAVFDSLGAYRDADERSRSIRYQLADSLSELGDFADAYFIFGSLGSYLDSHQRYLSVGYEYAQCLCDSGSLQTAGSVLQSLGNYLDAQERYQSLALGFFRFTEVEGIITDHTTGLQWRVGSDSTTTWPTARNWVRTLGNGWRMPTRDELQAIYHAGVSEDNWGPFPSTGRWVWTGEVREYEPNAYIVKFSDGTSGWHGQANPDYNYEDLRGFAVRSPDAISDVQITTIVPSPHSQRFQRSGEIITDAETGLQWRVGSNIDTNWYAASSWVDGLAGSWRMPTRDELLGLVEAGIKNTDWGPFYNSGFYVWTGEEWWAHEGDPYPSQAWFVDFYTGNESRWVQASDAEYRAFAVR